MQLAELKVSATLKVVLFYNMAFCYQRLEMIDDCIENLDLATHSLKHRIKTLEDEENYFKTHQKSNFDQTD